MAIRITILLTSTLVFYSNLKPEAILMWMRFDLHLICQYNAPQDPIEIATIDNIQLANSLNILYVKWLIDFRLLMV